MQCEERIPALNLFLDSSLEAADQQALFGHLSACEQCCSYVSTMMKIGRIQQTEQVPFPSEIDNAVLQRISTKRSLLDFVLFRSSAFPIPVPVACALIAAAMVLSFFVGRMNLPQKENTQAMQAALNDQQPSAVIYVYGLPPVDVIAKASEAVYQQNNQIKN